VGTPSLKPIRLRMERASEHAANLRTEIAQFLATNPYAVTHEFDTQAMPNEFPPGPPVVAIHRYRAQIKAEVPDRISILAGDVLKDLRSALDYAAWQLALAQSDSPPPTTAFPIFASEKLYRRDKARYIGGIDPSTHSLFDSVQPYHAGDKATIQPLWILHRMANDDKHKVPHVVGSVPVQVGADRPPGTDLSVGTTIGPFDNGDVVATVGIYKSPNPKKEPNLHITFDVAFGKDTPAESITGLYAEIDGIGREVDKTITKFAPFFG
jgi:hypothetical protein